MDIIETTSETPLCPHCNKPLQSVFARKIKSRLGVRFIYFCRACKKTLGISHRKGFWMG